jgi:signal transduction histidine kinase
MEHGQTQDDTAFAPSARVGDEVLAWQRNAFLSDSTAVALLEAMPGPTMVLNRQRQIVASNLQLQAMFSPEECGHLIGQRTGEIFGCVRAQERPTGCGTTPACARCGAAQAVVDSLSTRGRAVRECRIRTSFRTHGGALDLRVHATYAEVGGEELVIFALVDISHEKRRRVLEQALLHDLRSDCADTRTFAEHLKNEDIPAADDAVFRQEFSELSIRVLEQIESHRQLLAAEAGDLEVCGADVSLREMLEKIASACRQSGLGSGREIELHTEGPDTLQTDPVQLARVVDGLLRNALEATPSGGRVSLSAVRDSGGATIAVWNAGVIPMDVQHQIFQRSFSTKHGEGRGIGTYSAKLLVERYLEGTVEFRSDEARGTVFTVTVPDRSEGLRAA